MSEILSVVYTMTAFLEHLMIVPVATPPALLSPFFLQYLSMRCLRKNIKTGMWRPRMTTSRIKHDRCFSMTSFRSKDILSNTDPPEVEH